MRGPKPRRSVARLAVVLALTGVALYAASRAEAYVRYRTKTGIAFFWPQTCVPFSVYPESMRDVNGNMEMTPEQIVHATTEAAAVWGAGANACTFLRINVTEATGPTPNAGLDYNNVLVFQTTRWCPPNTKPGDPCYAPEALAITSVFDSSTTGRILDADIEVNAKGFLWADLDVEPAGKGKQDLQNALAHEMGHLIGLDHTCWSPGTPGVPDPPIDNEGNAVPNCDSASAEVQATTMFASAIPGDLQKRTLAPDDILAVCEAYPAAKDPMFCPAKDMPPEHGCAIGASGGGSGVAALSLLAAFGLAARRRRGRRT